MTNIDGHWILVVALLAPAAQAVGNWVGTITTEGDVTTVVNESGSVWPGAARLVEETRIGVEAGADEYMFGQISGVVADGERIIVADRQARVIRLFDYDGAFLGNVGGPGQGPGEFGAPEAVTIDDTGRIYVLDREHRVVGFEPDGTPGRTFPVHEIGQIYPVPGGGVRVQFPENDPERSGRRYVVQSYDPEGIELERVSQPESDFPRPTFRSGGIEGNLPLNPRALWGATPDGGLWTGVNDRYRFEILRADGSVLAIEKFWEPIPFEPDELEWSRRRTVAAFRSRQPGWNWDGAELPTDKPAYNRVVPVMSGGYWVMRAGPSVRASECTEDPLSVPAGGEATVARMEPCWTSRPIIDAFDAEGRFLGTVETPPLIGWSALTLHIDSDTVVTAAEDEDGVIRVVRYRLVPPQ